MLCSTMCWRRILPAILILCIGTCWENGGVYIVASQDSASEAAEPEPDPQAQPPAQPPGSPAGVGSHESHDTLNDIFSSNVR